MPFYSSWTYGIELVSRRHIADISQMTDLEPDALGEAVRAASGMYDSLFDTRLPYMMCMHNAPMHNEDPAIGDYTHFRIWFVPPMRSGTVRQYRASSESGAGAWCNPNCPEEKAAELRRALEPYVGRMA